MQGSNQSSASPAGPPPSEARRTILTVGHSTLPIAEFVELLGAHGVDLLVDVRRYPGSRRHPHFAREPLAAALATAGIAYHHEPGLGGRRRPRPDSPHTAWRVAGFRAYSDYMETAEFRAALARLEALAEGRAVAVMCAEAVPWRCHRRLVADALVARGRPVEHILSPTRVDPHELSPHAVVAGPDGKLAYPAGGARQGELPLQQPGAGPRPSTPRYPR